MIIAIVGENTDNVKIAKHAASLFLLECYIKLVGTILALLRGL